MSKTGAERQAAFRQRKRDAGYCAECTQAVLDKLNSWRAANPERLWAQQQRARAKRTSPTLPIPDDWPTGTCDWGRCSALAIDWRWDSNLQIWLPVCDRHKR